MELGWRFKDMQHTQPQWAKVPVVHVPFQYAKHDVDDDGHDCMDSHDSWVGSGLLHI